MTKTILITGGAGFIGSHLVEKYFKSGYKVVVVDDLSSGKLDNISNFLDHISFYRVDIRDGKSLEEVFLKHKPNYVNHHAAQKSVPYSVDFPLIDNAINIIGLLNLIELSKKYLVENFIFASSGGALATALSEGESSSETDTPQLTSPYAITKYAGENYLRTFAELYGFNYTVLRYANVYGPRQIPDGECGAIPIFVNNIAEGKQSTLMTYEDMPLGCTRDYVHVYDVVEANIAATSKSLNDVVNISSGVGMPMLKIYNVINEVYNKDVEIKIVGPRLGDIKRSVLNNKKAKLLLQWEPKMELKKGLEVI
jgi:UDP-glucose 4-epimerase